MPVNWVAVGAIASVTAVVLGVPKSLAGVYKHKHDQLDTKRERQSSIKKRFEGRGWVAPHLRFEIDDVTVEQRTGRRYRMKRLALRPLEGSTVISINTSAMFADYVLESCLIDDVEVGAGTEVEFIDSITGEDPPVLLFRVDSVEHEDIMPVVAMLTETLSAWRESKSIEHTILEPDKLRQAFVRSSEDQPV